MIDERVIERIIEASDIVDVIQDFRKLTRRGSNYECCCPVHHEDTPSFKVSPTRNRYHCFGCGIDGNAVGYLMDVEGMPFRDAIKYLGQRYNIAVEDADSSMTDEQRQLAIKREAMFAALTAVQQFFVESLKADDEKAAFARQYIDKRWGKRFGEQEGIGYAPDSWSDLKKWAAKKNLPQKILIELGVLKESEAGRVYDGFRGRVTIPIRDRYNRVIGFTARSLSGDKEQKYLNSPTSAVYDKSRSIFGIHNAVRQATKEGIFYLVEGGPDVLRLQSIGVHNTIAPLGTAWTEHHFEQLKKFNAQLCFIPDIDEVKPGDKYGAGIKAVIKNGLAAFNAGFQVSVKEIIPDKLGEKVDPDTYIQNRKILDGIATEDFVIWYAKKLVEGTDSANDKAKAIKAAAAVLASIEDSVLVDTYIAQLRKIFGGGSSLWKNAVNEAIKDNVDKKDDKQSKLIDTELYQKYGFFERRNSYISIDKDGHEKEWSNFTMEPLFHIRDKIKPKRLYKLRNTENDSMIIELSQEDLGSLQRFKVRVEGEGNYIWATNESDLTKLKRFLYAKTDTATEIKQLGWDKDGFFAFGNGIYHDRKWHEADEYGIVKLGGELGNYYLPAASVIYKSSRELFQFERRFVLTNYSAVPLKEYAEKMIAVFGDNAKVGLCYFLATLFKDVVTRTTKNFPILNLFGPKGSGKSELGHSLMSFFIINNDPPNLSTSTLPGLAETVAQAANALVHLDEYKNSIELQRSEFLKSLYDCVGRTRINMDRDKKKETTAVDSGVIVSGQEMPTVDIALFSRMVYLTFDKTEFSPEAKKRFSEMKEIRDRGCSHMIPELLRHRAKFEAEFAGNYKSTLNDIVEALGNEVVEDRILRNWVIPLAAYRVLMGLIDLPFTYREMLDISTRGIIKQNTGCRSNNELANFWSAVDFLHQNGEIFIDADYKIKYVREFRSKGMKEKMEFRNPRPILYLCIKRIMPLYKRNAKQMGETTSSIDSLRHYLETSKEYLGTVNAIRFKNVSNTREAFTQDPSAGGQTIATSRVDWALCFDYSRLAEAYGINLEVDAAHEDDVDLEKLDTTDKTVPFNDKDYE